MGSMSYVIHRMLLLNFVISFNGEYVSLSADIR